MSEVGRVGIVGLGHIGGSLALALRDAGVEVVATSPSASTRELAAANGVGVVGSVDALVERSDVVVVAAALHVLGGVVIQAVDAAARQAQPPTVTDAGSVKVPVVEQVRKGTDHHSLFVPGHPMAGNEGSGFASAVPHLFSRRTWAVTPAGDVGLDRWAAVARVALAVGSTVVPVAADEHDDAVALTSHLPYALAALVAGTVGAEHGLLRSLAAGSYDSLTRVAGGHESLGSAMALRNRAALVPRLRTLAKELETLADRLVEVTDPDDVSRLRDPGRTIHDVFESGFTSKRADARPAGASRTETLVRAELLELGRSGGRVVGVDEAGPDAVTVEVVS
ncbi:MAG TPA: prephenate dehydrogenase/arogenate dehydrogenase family protein [Iamia sp.]|nr:prephenate dehydrogenase/arogenate dehydrogenase family protein [Iamia sp.]